MSATFVYIHLGKPYNKYQGLPEPNFAALALAQCRFFDNARIHFITDRANVDALNLPPGLGVEVMSIDQIGISEKHAAFRTLFAAKSTFNAGFRDGFWSYVIERFFVIESWMRALDLSDVFHSENDNLVYFNGDALARELGPLYPGLGVTFDSDKRGVAGLCYIHRLSALAAFTDFILRHLAEVPSFDKNDMELLALFRREAGAPTIDHLPMMPDNYPGPIKSRAGEIPAAPQRFWRNVDRLGGIFDGTAIGQYLGGTDPRNIGGISVNTTGFINETCVFDPSRFTYRTGEDRDGRKIPYLTCAGRDFRIYNLHIHSKNLRPFCSFEQ